MIVFAKLADEVIEKEPIALDVTIMTWLHSVSSPVLDMIFLTITTLGNVEYMLPALVALFAYFVYRGQRHNALILLFGAGGAALSNIILKLVFHRDRPSLWNSAIVETGYSFPSGHAMMSSALVLCLVVLLWHTKWRLATIVIGSIFVIMMGVSRVYLGVHYPTDIVAGWSVSCIWVLMVVAIFRDATLNYFRRLRMSLFGL